MKRCNFRNDCGTLQSVGQVIGSATFVNSDVVAMSTIFKIVRIIFIVFVALIFSKLNTNEGENLLSRSNTVNEDKKVKAKIPWYIIGFFLFSIIATFNIIPEIVSHTAHTISGQFEIIALAGIGMRVKFRDLIKDGPKALLYRRHCRRLSNWEIELGSYLSSLLL